MPTATTSKKSKDSDARTTGAVYTPPFLARWVAGLLVNCLPARAKTVADFACGEGALLQGVAARSRRPLDLIGADIDRAALRRATERLPDAEFRQIDAIGAALREKPLGKGLGFENLGGIILNPPWGIDTGIEQPDLREAGFELATGQFDSADLFLELAVNLLDEGSAGAFILPDSLFSPDHAPTRRLLLETCTISLLARLGEGFFPGIFRGTAVVVLRRGTAGKRHAIQCLRLTPKQRKLVLSGSKTLEQLFASSAHSVPQSRFARSPNATFAIDVRQADIHHVRAVYSQPPEWTQTLESGRGVELSKHGEIVLCPTCGLGRPRPRKASLVFCECGAAINQAQSSATTIVRPLRSAQSQAWKPLIAGEDVKRYRCEPSREIRVGIDGINYKAGIDFGSPRLLVRKTGIGLKAAMYQGSALTTQTVFHYQATKESPGFFLAYVLGMLSSRIMLAIHLKRTGELEWRSHPYVTQSLLAELPIPHPEPNSQQWRQAQAISKLASDQHSRPASTEQDLAIERLVGGIYGLSAENFEWVDRVLNEAQALEGVASLRFPDGIRLSPSLVD